MKFCQWHRYRARIVSRYQKLTYNTFSAIERFLALILIWRYKMLQKVSLIDFNSRGTFPHRRSFHNAQQEWSAYPRPGQAWHAVYTRGLSNPAVQRVALASVRRCNHACLQDLWPPARQLTGSVAIKRITFWILACWEVIRFGEHAHMCAL